MREGANTKTNMKKEEEVLQAQEQRSPTAQGEDHGKAGYALKPTEYLSGADIHPEDQGGPYATVGECAPKEVASQGEIMLNQFLAGYEMQSRERSTHGSRFSDRNFDPMG